MSDSAARKPGSNQPETKKIVLGPER